ncbi:MAG: lanthionine synthetase LanC family protein [Puia sp.]|nr:lanthionine synthetase LanC family protein [Puia sp.]
MENAIDIPVIKYGVGWKYPNLPMEDYGPILSSLGLEPAALDHYYLIGEIIGTQGWVLHISVIREEIADLLRTILPLLRKENIPFKAAIDGEAARCILSGEWGYIELGKIVSIYPPTDDAALRIARQLIAATQSFKSPVIPTDRHLGGAVYTRYGAFNPVIISSESGVKDAYIYDAAGELVKDLHTMPFTLPKGIPWPFTALTDAVPAPPDTVLSDKYKVMSVLKEDAKGDVKKALWLKHWYQVVWCVIKEGRRYMNSDADGRDIGDRLKWQYELHTDLQDILPIPRVHDLFSENGNTYLVMDFVKGKALDMVILDLFERGGWEDLLLSDRLRLLDYAVQVSDIIEKMHQKGYVHRDITPMNFLVKKNGEIWMIDLELSYNEDIQKPFPPFRLGTYGFMSPEQQETEYPTPSQDIYSLGATLITLLTGLLPGKFALEHKATFKRQFLFFIPDPEFVNILAECFNPDPQSRPPVSILKESLFQFRERQINLQKLGINAEAPELDQEILKNVIIRGLRGLNTPTLVGADDLWFSKTIQEEGMAYYQMETYTVYPGFYEGLSGVMYLLALAHRCGFSIEHALPSYQKSQFFIREYYRQHLPTASAGLYGGTSGVGMALAEGVRSELIADKDEVSPEIFRYLENEKIDGNGIVKGLAGRGMALLKILMALEDGARLEPLLQDIVGKLLSRQEKDGSWTVSSGKEERPVKITGWGHGVAGIVCFLLAYMKRYPQVDVGVAIRKALAWLIGQSKEGQGKIHWRLNGGEGVTSSSFQDGGAGIALTFIKAYELFENVEYRKIAEAALADLPPRVTSRDITQADGLAGAGEVYLEAARVFGSAEWRSRAGWTAQFILHHFRLQQGGTCYWLPDATPFPTAGFMNGNSGIIHFLLRTYKPELLNHPFFDF